MNLEKLKPWNWFKHENAAQDSQKQIPVTKGEANQLRPSNIEKHAGADSLFRLHHEMDRLFDDVFNAFGLSSSRPSLFDRSILKDNTIGSGVHSGVSYHPNIDVSGDDKQYEITLDVPGLSQDDIAIETHGDVLTIKGEKEENAESKDKHYYRVERRYGSFQRTLSLPEDANANDISARLQDGVLYLSIPRQAIPECKVKRIPIQG